MSDVEYASVMGFRARLYETISAPTVCQGMDNTTGGRVSWPAAGSTLTHLLAMKSCENSLNKSILPQTRRSASGILAKRLTDSSVENSCRAPTKAWGGNGSCRNHTRTAAAQATGRHSGYGEAGLADRPFCGVVLSCLASDRADRDPDRLAGLRRAGAPHAASAGGALYAEYTELTLIAMLTLGTHAPGRARLSSQAVSNLRLHPGGSSEQEPVPDPVEPEPRSSPTSLGRVDQADWTEQVYLRITAWSFRLA